MLKAYTTFKNSLKKHYNSCGTYEQARDKLPKSGLWNERPISHWHWLCDNVFNDPTHKVCDYTTLPKIKPIFIEIKNADLCI